MRLLTRSGSSLSLWLEHIYLSTIASAAIDPFAVYDASSKGASDASLLGKFIDSGFSIENHSATQGDFYAITWSQYQDYLALNKEKPYDLTALAAITPAHIGLGPHEWCITPLVKIYAANSGTYVPTAGLAVINVGRIL
jgi:hypothetical protein